MVVFNEIVNDPAISDSDNNSDDDEESVNVSSVDKELKNK
jgi:hypothetical protein